MKRTVRYSLSIVAILSLLASETTLAQHSSASQLPNGFYSVIQADSLKDLVPASGPGHTTIVYDGRYIDSTQADSPEYVTIDTISFVPLILEGSPVAKKDGSGWTSLSVTLSQKYIGKLGDFTKAHLGGRLAILLGGEIISMHKIRSVISEGKIQISRCHDNACDILLSKLAQ
jgi:preprotein translocase subunit SecD